MLGSKYTKRELSKALGDCMYIKIINNSCTHVTRKSDPDDSWDRGNTDTYNDIQGIEIVEKDDWYDLETEFDLIKGREYYLVYCEYTTGDSFGSDGGRIDFIQLYKTLDKAEACIKDLRGSDDKYSGKIIMESGRTLIYGIPWTGYFESLENLDVVYVMVQ
jgi:hypothetical protein